MSVRGVIVFIILSAYLIKFIHRVNKHPISNGYARNIGFSPGCEGFDCAFEGSKELKDMRAIREVDWQRRQFHKLICFGLCSGVSRLR